jgi:hypothetical protein|tara:strand:- start:33272 stop:33988 length:717 start_codon:yes stop_codon:yes gene_type:complete
MNKDELFVDNARDGHWIGEVVVNEDPLNDGRCRVKVFGKFDLLPDEAIPWATPQNRETPGAHAVPRVGDIVAVRFDNGNIYHPEYWFQVDQNVELKEDILNNSDAPYDVISLVYDAERNLRIYHSPEDGLVITRGSGAKERPMIQIDEEGFIKISTDAKMFLDCGDIFISNTGEGGADEEQPAVRGQSLQDWLQMWLDDYNTHIHPTGVGPSGPPMPPTPVVVGQLSSTHPDYQQRNK